MTPDEAVARIPRLEALPESYQRLQTIAERPHSTAEDVAAALSEDQGLASRCLRLANSPLYAFPSRIDTVARAVAVVGTRQICQLALAGSVIEAFKDLGVEGLRRMWRHGIACALTARQLSLGQREASSERLFVAGLLHDVGEAVLAAASGLSAPVGDGEERIAAERNRWGCDHAQVGACLLARWNLPDSLVDAVGRHHQAPCPCHAVDCAMVSAAEGIATALALDGNHHYPALPVVPECWSLAGVRTEALSSLAEEVERQFEEVAMALGMGRADD